MLLTCSQKFLDGHAILWMNPNLLHLHFIHCVIVILGQTDTTHLGWFSGMLVLGCLVMMKKTHNIRAMSIGSTFVLHVGECRRWGNETHYIQAQLVFRYS